VINWVDASVIDKEPDRPTRWIKEVIHVRKEGQRAMNREEGSYQLELVMRRTTVFLAHYNLLCQ